MNKISPLPNVCKPYSYVTAICHIFYSITRNFGGVLKSMLSSDVTIIDIKEHQIKRLKVVIKLF